MANMCTIARPAGFNATNWQQTAIWTTAGVTNPSGLAANAKSADAAGGSYYFDADKFGISCVAFPSASGSTDPLISQASAIQALQAALVGVQGQISAMAPWVGENAEDAQAERIQDMSDAWILFFGAAIVIFCLKGIQRLFNRGPHDD